MIGNELLGAVAQKYLSDCLAEQSEDGSTARYLLDTLSPEQTAAVANSILHNDHLNARIEIWLPKKYVKGMGLPDHILTDERATYYRNAECAKEALLLATTGDDEQQSLRELMPIGATQLLSSPQIWVDVANSLLPIQLSDVQCNWWRQALNGLLRVKSVPLDMVASYMVETVKNISEEGEPLLEALGLALPALRIPRDKGLFAGLNDKNAGHVNRWQALFNKAIRQRSCYLLKYNPSQSLLSQDSLESAYEKTREDIPALHHNTVEKFIASGSGWSQEAAALAECEWEDISSLFNGLKKEKYNLGQKTIDFYDEREATLLTDSDREYLDLLKKRKLRAPEEEDENFYESHRLELQDDRSLKAKWDKFIFGTPLESDDFLVGLVQALEGFFGQKQDGAKSSLRIQSDRRTKQDLRQINHYAALHFAVKYKGLQEALPRAVEWDVGELFNFPSILSDWKSDKSKKIKLNRSQAKAALRIKFYLEFRTIADGKEDVCMKQLVWSFKPNSVASQYARDIDRLKTHPIQRAMASREVTGTTALGDSIDLSDTRTLHPSYAQDRGSFIPAYKKEDDLAKVWPANLGQALSLQAIPSEDGEDLQTKWDAFVSSYGKAMAEMNEYGIQGALFKEQADRYRELISEICTREPGDRARSLLLRPILEIGVAQISGGSPAAIVTPWHPLRMLATSVKVEQAAAVVAKLVSDQPANFSDARLYFREMAESVGDIYYPELAVGWEAEQAKLLSHTDYELGYSLHEPPTVNNEGTDETNENPSATSKLIVDLIKRYLRLFPHERANLSTVLYNCDSARLPQAVVAKVMELHDLEDDMRCEIVLRHRDRQRLSELYEKIVDASDRDADVYATSENTTDFMARLRIGIMADQAPPPVPGEGRPTDIVFLQDVVARLAKLEWFLERESSDDACSLNPAQWTRKRPAVADDMKSICYLASPVQTHHGWSYLKAVSSFFKSDWNAYPGKCFMPVRQLDFSDAATSQIFSEVHNLGNWVANYDELLDRRQLMNQNVRIIRYKQTKSLGRNLLISSTAPTGLLRSMVKRRIGSLNTSIPAEELDELAERFIQDANLLSGDLALRAAKRGNNASELMGVVLSRYLTEQEIGRDKDSAWFFMDDYAEWLGQKEEQIADILALCPETDNDGRCKLGVIVTEAKYIDFASLSSKQKESQKQVRDTVRRIRNALFSSPVCLDRDLWLSRFSNMITSGLHLPQSKHEALTHWKESLRKGNCEVYVRGYSHVFIHGPSDSPDCSDAVPMASIDDCFQETYSRKKLRDLVERYHAQTDASSLRQFDDSYAPATKAFRSISVDPPDDPKAQMVVPTPEGAVTTPSVPESIESTTPPAPKYEPTASKGVSPEDGLLDARNGQPRESSSMPPSKTLTDEAAKKWLDETASHCKMALLQFQLRAKLLDKKLTPNCAILKFEGSSNLTVEQVERKRGEFLTTYGLNVTGTRAEPNRVCIYIERPNRQIIRLEDAWQRWKPAHPTRNCELLIGIREDDDNLLHLSPRKNAPHTLIAGSTGSGKSVLMQNIILNIAMTSHPSNARILLIDPKRVSFTKFKNLPHLNGDIIKQPEDSAAALEAIVGEMDRRYSLFEEYEVEDIYELNSLGNGESLPYLWVIHDEFALWMLDENYAATVESVVNSLAVAARAAGIFLIFAAQRPDKDVLPMQLRSNLGNRLVLKVDSAGTSEIALGMKNLGAEKLLGNGHMLASLEGSTMPVYVQVPFVPKDELATLVKSVITKWENS